MSQTIGYDNGWPDQKQVLVRHHRARDETNHVIREFSHVIDWCENVHRRITGILKWVGSPNMPVVNQSDGFSLAMFSRAAGVSCFEVYLADWCSYCISN